MKYYKANEVGEGLPFAFVDYGTLISNDNIFMPSLRDFHVVFWVKKGRGKYFLDFGEFDFEPDMLILLSKDQLYHFLPFDHNSTEIVSVPFKPEFLYKTAEDLKHLFNFNALKLDRGQNNTLKVDPDTAVKLERLCSEMDALYQGNEWHKSASFYHYLNLFLIQCEVLLKKEKPLEALDEKDPLIAQFDELLEQHFREEFNVSYYADRLHMTPKALAKLTKKTYQHTPKTLIDDRRLLEIKRMLKGTNKSGKEIAVELNFDEPTNMFKFFRKHTGMSPSEFRSQ